jgi:hypothetical protein
VGGLYLFLIEFSGTYFVGRVAAAAGFMIALGGYWLWGDFLKSAFRRTKG